jgi:catechol 2,3-dioxygenase-like lactoylglutathione lyase family enzyme
MSGPRLLHGTVSVPDMKAALDVYAGLLEQRIVEDAQVSAAESRAWLAPAVEGARSVTLQPPSGRPVYLRLIEQKHLPSYRPGTHLGWAALELTVQSADRMHERLVAAGIPIIGAPKALAFTDKLYPMQALGPGGEAMYLNEVRGNLPNSDLPMAACWVDELFITIVATRSLDRSISTMHYWVRQRAARGKSNTASLTVASVWRRRPNTSCPPAAINEPCCSRSTSSR